MRKRNILERIAKTGNALSLLPTGGINPFRLEIDELLEPAAARIEGRETILFGINNYLGMNHDSDCIAAAKAAIDTYGLGSTASRVTAGTLPPHLDLEQAVADLYGWPHATVFSTAFMANIGVIAGLTGPGDLVIIDEHCHASIFDGGTMSGAEVVKFAHNDAAALDAALSRSGVPGGQTLVIVEALYSVLGDLAPLAEIVAVKDRHGALLMVDEAHSLGIYGARGAGLAEELALLDKIDLITGTFSKSVGNIGGFCVSKLPELAHLYTVARPYIFTASIPPSIAAASARALRKIAAGETARDRLWANVRRLHGSLVTFGYDVTAGPSPIIGINVPGARNCCEVWLALFERGVLTNLLIPPATPEVRCMLRCSVSALHTEAQIDTAIETFAEVAEIFGMRSTARADAMA